MIAINFLGIKIEILPLFFGILTIFLISDINGIANYVLMFSALHEIGHIVFLIIEKVKPKRLKLSVSGIMIELGNDIAPSKKIAIYCAGFAVNFILALIYFFIGNKTASAINLIIGFFTMYPLPSTDGGSIFHELFSDVDDRAVRIADIVFETLFTAFIIFSAIFTKNWYLLSAVFYLAVCILNY